MALYGARMAQLGRWCSIIIVGLKKLAERCVSQGNIQRAQKQSWTLSALPFFFYNILGPIFLQN